MRRAGGPRGPQLQPDTAGEEIRAFAKERDWERFHTPKNLAMALAGEVGELVAELQWLEREELDEALAPGTELHGRLTAEVADVFIYLLRLADTSDIDLIAAARDKLRVNASRYPVETARGTAHKYSRLDG
ncbi:MAG: nucleotide pyrophosphohydrolase [Actinomycetota bacterium]|nr:nucleotide pyrophosphohydrolase [Actinomycetota bacterium]